MLAITRRVQYVMLSLDGKGLSRVAKAEEFQTKAINSDYLSVSSLVMFVVHG